MKKTDKISYRQKSVVELSQLLLATKKKLAETKAKYLTGNHKDSSVFKKIRYEITLINSIISENKKENGPQN